MVSIYMFVAGCLFGWIPCMLSLPPLNSLGLQGSVEVQDISDGYFLDSAGRRYGLSELKPMGDLLSSDRYVPVEGDKDKDNATHLDPTTLEVIAMPIYRCSFKDGTTIQVEKGGDGTILSAELYEGDSGRIVHFVKTEDCNVNELVVFTDDQMDAIALGALETDEEFDAVDAVSSETVSPVASLRNTSSPCPRFQVVRVGVVYDAEFCEIYGSKLAARSRIMMIVAAASLLYERDMCVKLQLVDIYTPDEDCNGTSSFVGMARNKACGSGATFIRDFRFWMNDNRHTLGLDSDATFHAFTGYPPSGTLGCAYIGTVCTQPQFSYGVGYMNSNLLSTQSIIFAHELGHNLNARHLSSVDDAAGSSYIMESSIQNPNQGFSETSIASILGWLSSPKVTCEGLEFVEPPSFPSSQPTRTNSLPPSEIPSLSPSWLPSLAPTPPETTSTPTPTLDENCLASSGEPICILGSRDWSLFACYEVEELLQHNNCTVPFNWTLESCQLASDTPRSNDGVWDSFSHAIPSEQSNDESLNSFYSEDCRNIGCTMAGTNVCFPTYLGRRESEVVTYEVTFSMSESWTPETTTVTVTIQKREPSEGSNCDVGAVRCFHL